MKTSPTIEIPSLDTNVPPSSTVRFDEHATTFAEVEDKTPEYEKLFLKQEKMQKKYPQSQLSVPGVHSSRV